MTSSSAADDPRTSMRPAVVAGVAWTTGGQLVRMVAQVGLQLALARLLAPAEFGLLAQALVFVAFAGLLADFGVEAALVQHRSPPPSLFDAVFWLLLAIAGGVAVVIVASAGAIASFYDEPRLVGVTRLLAVTLPLTALNVVPRAVLQRQLRFRSIAVCDVVGTCVAAAAALAAAAAGAGVGALVTNAITSVSVTAVALWIAARWRPRWPRFAGSGPLLRTSGYLAGFNVINFWSRNADNMLVGRSLGAAALGLYTRGYSLMLYPLAQISSVLGRVMLPTLSRMQDDHGRLREAYLRAVGAIALVAMPLMGLLLALAADLEDGVFGDRWQGVTPILRVFAVVGAAQAVTTTVGWVYVAVGRTDTLFRWGLGSAAVIVASFVVGIRIGTPLAVAWCYLIAAVVILGWPTLAIPYRLIDLPVSAVGREVAFPVLATAVLAATAAGASALVESPVLGLVAGVASGLAAYVVLVLRARPRSYVELLAAVRRRPGAPA